MNYQERLHERDADLIEINDIFGDSDPLIKYYVEPNCQNINPANLNEDEPDAVVRTPVFDSLNNYLNREFVIQGDGRNQLFILSDAGLGKSSLLVMIKLCELLPKVGWQFDVENKRPVELIKLDASALGKVRAIENKNNTILLLDALDEDPLAWQKPERRLLKVLQASSNFRRVIITCRTQFFPEKGVSSYGTQEKLSIGGFVCPIVFLSPFDHKQVSEYLDKRFPNKESPDELNNIERSCMILENAKSLSFRPFLLSHIEDLLNSEEREWTELSVYDELVSVWILREVRKKSAANLSEEQLRLACIAIAAKMQESGVRYLTKNELDKLIKKLPEIGNVVNVEYGSKSLLNRNSEGNYRFSHFSVQEYFLSKYVIELSIPDRKYEINPIKLISVVRNKIRLTRKCLEFISLHHNPNWSYGNAFLLDDMILDGFDFSDVSWNGCSFSRSSLRDANLSGSDISEANFSDVTLVGADLSNSVCMSTIFSGVDFSQADLQQANASDAKFGGAKFNDSNLKGLVGMDRPPKDAEFIDTIMPTGKRKTIKRLTSSSSGRARSARR
ncbi:pentapeptide repeat-containing protein [Endothiovibrio diazotrophicus]